MYPQVMVWKSCCSLRQLVVCTEQVTLNESSSSNTSSSTVQLQASLSSGKFTRLLDLENLAESSSTSLSDELVTLTRHTMFKEKLVLCYSEKTKTLSTNNNKWIRKGDLKLYVHSSISNQHLGIKGKPKPY